LLANLITLTPGTLSVDVSDNRRTLYIHAIHVPDPEA
jgi:multicomponent Na+:H+ antiporter subunit E